MGDDLLEIRMLSHSNDVYGQIVQTDQVGGVRPEVDSTISQLWRSSTFERINYAERRCLKRATRYYRDRPALEQLLEYPGSGVPGSKTSGRDEIFRIIAVSISARHLDPKPVHDFLDFVPRQVSTCTNLGGLGWLIPPGIPCSCRTVFHAFIQSLWAYHRIYSQFQQYVPIFITYCQCH